MVKRAVHVESCPGPTPTARLARLVAEQLRRRPELPARGAGAIAIDGCASACASRTIAGKGERVAAIQLQELGVAPGVDLAGVDVEALAAKAAARLDALARSRSAPRRPRRPQPPPVSSADRRRAHTSDDYLFALSMLTTPVVSCGARATDLPTLAAHVARSLGVSRSAAGEMVQRLEREGLIEHGPHKEILLTAAGHEAAAGVVRRHRLVERMLTDSLGYTPAESYRLALQIRDGCDDTLIERIAAQLTLPERCPHGWPIEVSEEHAEMAELVSLAALRAGAATVVALLESDEDTLTYLGALGIEPDAEVRVLDGGAGQIAVEVDGRQCVLDRDRASTVFVRSTIQ